MKFRRYGTNRKDGDGTERYDVGLDGFGMLQKDPRILKYSDRLVRLQYLADRLRRVSKGLTWL